MKVNRLINDCGCWCCKNFIEPNKCALNKEIEIDDAYYFVWILMM